MRVCLLDTVTKKVINVVSLNSPEEHNPTPGIEVAPQHDGDIGWTWTESGWVYPQPPEPTLEELAEKQRELRDKWLRIYVDKINAIRWEAFTQQQKNDWIAYRQALLDVPQQEEFPNTINWPIPPEL
jgi:hypothetical protein